MLLLYGSTYFTPNTIDTITSLQRSSISTTDPSLDSDSPTQQSPPANGLLKFGTVLAVNMSLSLYKDGQTAKLFGAVTARPLPTASYAALLVRDSMTICVSFNLPPIVAPPLSSSFSPSASLAITQFTVPALMQPINTPLYLLGLDFYNRCGRLSWRERWRKVEGYTAFWIWQCGQSLLEGEMEGNISP